MQFHNIINKYLLFVLIICLSLPMFIRGDEDTSEDISDTMKIVCPPGNEYIFGKCRPKLLKGR